MQAMHTIKSFFNSEHRLLFLMLITLITAITLGLETAIAKSLLLTHFGLFLLWQPIFKQEVSFNVVDLIILIAFTAVFITWVNLWITAFWVLLLGSLLNGRIFARGLYRATYALAVIILFLELILVITPTLFGFTNILHTSNTTINILLMVCAIPLLFIPSHINASPHVDFIRGFMIVLLTLFLCMGSVIITLTTQQPYLYSLATATFVAALFLFSASLLWAPRAGFSGIAQLWEKYLLNIDGPFEHWVSKLATLDINSKITPDTFLKLSVNNLLQLDWIIGIYSKTSFGENTEGKTSKHFITYEDEHLKFIVYSNSTIGTALLLHSKLLFGVLSFYYKAKLQEQQLINQAHLHAIYETGSKLTHDVKNILQSTQTLAEVVAVDDGASAHSHKLLQKQLPLLTQRLKTTLEKLSSPINEESKPDSLTVWWQEIIIRYTDETITFTTNLDTTDSDLDIFVDVFDAFIENAIENARQKQQTQRDITINVTLNIEAEHFELIVCDNGSAIKKKTAQLLFKSVLSSENGYGIGLYQSYQQAQSAGYNLSLSNNEAGKVCFCLTNITQ